MRSEFSLNYIQTCQCFSTYIVYMSCLSAFALESTHLLIDCLLSSLADLNTLSTEL